MLQTRTISVVSEETKKQLDQMIAQNKELEEILAKSRSDYNAKVRHVKMKTLFIAVMHLAVQALGLASLQACHLNKGNKYFK